MRRDQSEDYLDPKDVRVYRDAPGGGYNITRAIDESAVAVLNSRADQSPIDPRSAVVVNRDGFWAAPIIGHIPPRDARGVNLMTAGRDKAPINLHNVGDWASNARRTTEGVLR